ncbi:MAG TPA: cupin domain-containing protein [Ktedonobacterales bacterium]|nr:cupin domain-containing protein [Ktedonobacterales bacterium]
MRAFALDDTLRERQQAGRLYFEFLRVPALSAGVYVLPAGGADPQQPHAEDELYYVASGAGSIEVDGESLPVRAGSLIYVPAHAPHRFHTITEELRILVFFAPAEYTQAQQG